MVSRFAAHSQQNERDARPQGLFVNRRFGILLCGRMWATVSFFVVEMFLHLAIGCADNTLLHAYDDSYLWQMRDELHAVDECGSRYTQVSAAWDPVTHQRRYALNHQRWNRAVGIWPLTKR